MATINNNLEGREREVTREIHHSDGGSAGWAVALVILALIVLFLIFGFPGQGTNTDVTPDVNVPDEIDVNVNPE